MIWARGIISLLVAWGIGWGIVVIVAPTLRSRRGATAVAGVFSATVGLVVTTYLYWLWITLLRTTGLPYLALEAVVVVTLAVWAHLRWHAVPRPSLPAGRMNWATWLILLVIATAMVMTFAGLAVAVLHKPHGGWDAWDFWNVKAKYLYFAEPTWTAAFLGGACHGDYPLLLPLTIARMWCFMGSDSVVGPQLAVMFFMLVLTLTPVAALAMLRGGMAAMLGLLILLSWPYLLIHSAMQYADLPLAAVLLAAALAAVLALENHEPGHLWFALTGLLGMSAAWTKNEGIPFIIVLAVSMCLVMLVRRRGGRMLIVMLLGAALPLACLLWMKLVYAPADDLTGQAGFPVMWARAQDYTRHLRILHTLRFILLLCVNGWLFWLLVAVWLLLRGVRIGAGAWVWLAVAATQLVVYYLIYLFTPYELSWHLYTSALRLFTQVWPLLALLPIVLARPAGRLDYNPPPCPHDDEVSPATC